MSENNKKNTGNHKKENCHFNVLCLIKDKIFDIINKDYYDIKALENFIKKYLPQKLGQSTKLIVDFIMNHVKEKR